MKKTLTIMMTAATALFGLSSCSDSDNNSSSSAAPISVGEFGSGDKFYELDVKGATVTLKGSNGTEGAQADSVTVTLTMETTTGTYVANGVAYSVSGATATLGGIKWSATDQSQLAEICSIWGLDLVEESEGSGSTDITLGDNSVFSIEISGGWAVLKAQLDDSANVTASDASGVRYKVTVKTDKAETSGENIDETNPDVSEP